MGSVKSGDGQSTLGIQGQTWHRNEFPVSVTNVPPYRDKTQLVRAHEHLRGGDFIGVTSVCSTKESFFSSSYPSLPTVAPGLHPRPVRDG